jgi:hypothetical protein
MRTLITLCAFTCLSATTALTQDAATIAEECDAAWQDLIAIDGGETVSPAETMDVLGRFARNADTSGDGQVDKAEFKTACLRAFDDGSVTGSASGN